MRISVAWAKLLSILYVSFSLIPFFLGWVKLMYGVPLLLLLLLGIYNYTRNLNFQSFQTVEKKDFFLGLLVIFIWVSFSGAGGMGYQVSDLFKSNTLLEELTKRPWPLEYDVEGETMYLSHYLAYYLPGPTLVGFLGYKYAQLFLFFYTLLGVSLGFFWLYRFAGGKFLRFSFLMIIFGGIATFSMLIKYKTGVFSEFWNKILNHGYVFWLNSWDVIPLNFMSISDQLYWTPQHFIPAIIGIGILLNDAYVDRDIRHTPFFLSLLAMWSPMVLVSLFFPFAFVLLQKRFKGIWNVTNLIIAPAIFFVTGSFLLAIESEELVKHFIFTDLTGRGFSTADQAGIYVYFLVFELFIWAIPIYLVLKSSWAIESKQLFFFTIGALSLIPLYRFGLWNDWCTRVSMGSLVILAIFAYKALMASAGWKRVLMIVLFVLGSHAVTIGFLGSFIESGYRVKFDPPSEPEVLTLPEICVGYPITQFVAPSDSFFYTYLAQKP